MVVDGPGRVGPAIVPRRDHRTVDRDAAQWAPGHVPGFGLTITILTGGRYYATEDDGRVGLYKRFCNILDVGSGANLRCRG